MLDKIVLFPSDVSPHVVFLYQVLVACLSYIIENLEAFFFFFLLLFTLFEHKQPLFPEGIIMISQLPHAALLGDF